MSIKKRGWIGRLTKKIFFKKNLVRWTDKAQYKTAISKVVLLHSIRKYDIQWWPAGDMIEIWYKMCFKRKKKREEELMYYV